MYKVDVITGACVAEISVQRDAHKSVIYTYSGSAIVSYPLSSGSYSGVISAAVGVAASIMSGSVLGAVASASMARAKTEVGGSFSGAPGAMGGKKPYLIITRPISKLAYGENTFDGYPSGETNLIGNCIGFIKCFDVHLRIDTATDKELDEIRELLLSGVRLTSANDGGVVTEPDYISVQPLYATENTEYNNPNIGGYMPVTVNVPPYNTPEQVGLVVDSNGDLITQTQTYIDTNGTYDTTYNNSIVVNVSGGGVDVPVSYVGYSKYRLGFPTCEYQVNIYGNTNLINALGAVLLGDFSNGGAATGNVLLESLSHFSGVALQGIYRGSKTSGYNTTMLYWNFELNHEYWTGMKDRNTTYDCYVTFTDDTHCNLRAGSRQVLIYGLP